MLILRRTLIGLTWLLAAVAVAIAATYGAGLVINQHDRPPSAAALSLADEIASIPQVADRDNGYLYLLGLAAPPDADPLEIGAERTEWIRRLAADPSLGRDTDPHPELSDFPAYPQDLLPIRSKCASAQDSGCFDALQANEGIISMALERDAWALTRYEALLARTGWREISTYDWRSSSIAPISAVPRFRILLFLQAWVLAEHGDAEGVNRLLQRDMVFWRRALADSSLLIDKMVAAGFVVRHLQWGSAILRSLPAADIARAIPESWRQPLSDEERSMLRAFAGEWRYGQNIVETLKTHGTLSPSFANEGDTAPQRHSAFWLFTEKHFLQPQDYGNRHAARLATVAAAAGAGYAELPAALTALRAQQTAGPLERRVCRTTL